MRVLLDEMLPPSLAQQLRRKGIDAIALVEREELVGASDDEVLAAAAGEDRVLVTANIGDFVRLHRSWEAEERRHAGILLVSSRRFPQDSSRTGGIVTALLRRARQATVGSIDFL